MFRSVIIAEAQKRVAADEEQSFTIPVYIRLSCSVSTSFNDVNSYGTKITFGSSTLNVA